MRVFIALKLPPEAKDNLEKIQNTLGRFASRGSLTPRPNMHLTLRFLGDVPAGTIQKIQEKMEFAAEAAPLEMSFCSVSALTSSVVAAKLKAKKDLFQIEECLSSNLFELRFPREERRFTPHVTLMRDYSFPLPFSEIAKNIQIFNKPFTADELILFETRFNKSAPVSYAELFTVKLNGAVSFNS